MGAFVAAENPPATTRQPLWKHVTKATRGYHRVTVVTSGCDQSSRRRGVFTRFIKVSQPCKVFPAAPPSGLHSSNTSAGEHTASYLPGEPQPADGGVVQTQNHSEEGQQVLLLLTAETQKKTLIFKPTTEEEERTPS